jgi:hypothetical protein
MNIESLAFIRGQKDSRHTIADSEASKQTMTGAEKEKKGSNRYTQSLPTMETTSSGGMDCGRSGG